MKKTLTKAEIARIRSLSQKKKREQEGRFIVEGEKMVQEALDSSFHVEAVYYRDEIGADMMEKISLLSTPSPALAVVHTQPLIHTATPPLPKGLCLALDGVRDPGNFGTILRIADWFGIERIYASEDCVEVYNPKTVQASMGAIFRKEVCYTPLVPLIQHCISNGIPAYGTFLDGNNLYQEKSDLCETALIVMGNEHNGISSDVSQCLNRRLFIPPYPQGAQTSESLNVAIATAILCAEFRRRLL